MRSHFNEISKRMEQLSRTRDLTKVFNDLLIMGICSFHTVNIQSKLQEKDETNEELYFDTIKPYSKKLLNLFARTLGEIQLSAYHYPYSDVLGEYFMQCVGGNQKTGQYFSPTTICDFMAEITGDDEPVIGKRVYDPACGSGRMLLSFAKKNPDNLFFGTDISQTCAHMSVLNCFLNGLRAEITWANGLNPSSWFGGWHINTNGLGITPIEKEQSIIWTKPPERQTQESSSNSHDLGNQLTLF